MASSIEEEFPAGEAEAEDKGIPPLEVALRKGHTLLRLRMVQDDIAAFIKPERQSPQPFDDYSVEFNPAGIYSPASLPGEGVNEGMEIEGQDVQDLPLDLGREPNQRSSRSSISESEIQDELETDNDSVSMRLRKSAARPQRRPSPLYNRSNLSFCRSIFEKDGSSSPSSRRSSSRERSATPVSRNGLKRLAHTVKSVSTQTQTSNKRPSSKPTPVRRDSTSGPPVQGKFLPAPEKNVTKEEFETLKNLTIRNAINAFRKAKGYVAEEPCTYLSFWTLLTDIEINFGTTEAFLKSWNLTAPSVETYLEMNRVYCDTYFPNEDYEEQMDYVVRFSDPGAKCMFHLKREWQEHLQTRTKLKSSTLRCKYWEPADPENTCHRKFNSIDRKRSHEVICTFKPYKPS